ncbi:MAG TPA: hypothetical protein VM942_00475 [Acidimicrobiales bacterium]|nr:hypothetical protein [Acidimicrobiales bacterium]
MTERTAEGRHPPGPRRRWEESYTFDFAAGDGSQGGYVRLGIRPGDGVAWYWAAFVSRAGGPHPPLVLVRDHDVPLPRGRSLEVRTSGLWADHTCETPLEHWTVGVEAFGVALDDPLEAFGRERGDSCPLGFDLEWEALRPAAGAGGAGGGHGYEQPCTVHGEVLVGAARLELDGIGWRTHRWGDRDWWASPGEEGAEPRAWAGGHFEADPTIDSPVDEPFATTDVDVAAEGGLIVVAELRLLGLTATPLAHAPVAIPGPDGRTSRLDRALCRYRSPSGREAVGWVEHLTPPPT